MKENIYLVGFMGVGKSAVSRALAKQLGVPCVDTDAEIERRQGRKISEIFAAQGEEAFRDMETAFLKELAESGGVVVSCGGGLTLRQENRELMKKSGKTVWLTATPETVYTRVRHSTNRPLLNGKMNPEAIGELMEERRGRYEAAAEEKIATDGRAVEDIALDIQRILFPSDHLSGSSA